MRLRLRLLVALAAALGTAVSAAPAFAATMASEHFLLTYTTDLEDSARLRHDQAADVLAVAERAYGTIVGEWGYPAPLRDADGKIDIRVVDLSESGVYGFAYRVEEVPAVSPDRSSGAFVLDVGAAAPAPADVLLRAHAIAHELFHVVQYGMFLGGESWLKEATAEWAAMRFTGFPDVETARLDMSLDCVDAGCADDLYDRGGYGQWPFFEFLAQRYGGLVVRDVFAAGLARRTYGLTGIATISDFLATKGKVVGDTFIDYTVANLTGGYTAPSLKGRTPTLAEAPLRTGATSGPLPSFEVAVNHLAARFVAFQRGNGSTGICYAATLSINVGLPAGIGARPFFYWNGPGGAAIPLAISGNTASIAVPWDTCSSSHKGIVSLPNPSLGADAQVFKVSATMTVDRSRVATATPPPAPWYTGPAVPAATADEPPTIALYGPETLRVSRKSSVIRLVVFSSGQGRLFAAVAGVSLGTRELRAGNNELRFTVPSALTRTLSSRGQLAVTSLAPSGASGATLTRKLVFTK